MASFTDGIEELAFLTRSAIRARLLQKLNQNGSMKNHELRRQFDCDRTTLQRNLDALVEHGWVQGRNGTYRITPAGELLAAGLFDHLDTVDTAMELRPFLRWTPDDALDIDIEHLAESDITVADSTHPHGAVSRHIDVMQTTEQFRGLIPSIGRHSLETTWRRVTSGEGTFEVVFTEDAATVLQSEPKYADMFTDILDTDRVQFFVSDDAIPYYLGIADDVVLVGVEDNKGMRRALLESEQDAVRAWAEDTYKAYRQRAQPLTETA